MRPTRNLWATGVLAVLFALLAVIFARPLLLAATALIGGWIVSRQYLFLTTLKETVDGMDVVQSSAVTGVQTGGTTTVTLAATLDTQCSLSGSIEAGVPPGGTATESLELSLTLGDTQIEQVTEIRWPIAGRHRFRQATLTMTDGLFTATLPIGSTPTVTVEPPEPRNIHVGEGGDRVALAQGEHESGRLGSGLEPAEIREYVSGDRTDRIDWNATARLDSLYVREYEAETDRPTVLCLDHRDSLSMGAPGETKLEYLREVALALTASARAAGDPIGLVTVGEKGLSNQIAPLLGPTHYTTIRRQLLDLEPGETLQQNGVTETDHVSVQPSGTTGTTETVSDGGLQSVHTASSTQPRSALAQLEQEDGAFAQTLEPFYLDRRTYSTQLESDPLLGAVQTGMNYQNRARLVLCTDDSDPVALRGAIRKARDQGGEVLVLLTPTVLFEPGGLADIEQAYERYVAFEDLRRELDGMEQVTALEVAPGDRLSSVLAAGRSRRRGDHR